MSKFKDRAAFRKRIVQLVAKLMTSDLKRFKVTDIPKEKILENADSLVAVNESIVDKWWRDGNPPLQADEMCENQITYPVRPTFLDWALK